MPISFEPLGERHVPLLTHWLQQPHVRAFWDDGERDEAAVRAHYFRPGRHVPGFVFLVDGQAAGFIQREQVTAGHPFFAWAAPHGETWGLDLLIGEEALTGQGLGPRVITAFLQELRTQRPATARLLIDPALDNRRALRAYVRAGFSALTVIAGENGPVQLMALDPG
jgi:aminoglycoside 6'-N-acetyltransferase